MKRSPNKRDYGNDDYGARAISSTFLAAREDYFTVFAVSAFVDYCDFVLNYSIIIFKYARFIDRKNL